MNISKIIAELRTERDRIARAITALESLNPSTDKVRRQQRPASASRTTTAKPKPRRAHRISSAARKRLSQMMKQRWAEKKKKAKTA